MTLLCLLSPAKRLEFSRPQPLACTLGVPQFAQEASRIALALKRLTQKQLQDLMGISASLAARAHSQYQAFSATADASNNSSRAALYAFHGDTYIGLNAYAWDKASVARAQTRLRILSGLYGILRPLDAIQPYRCEMGLRLGKLAALKSASEFAEVFADAALSQLSPQASSQSLAHFWRGRVALALQSDIDRTGARWLVNLASKEYIRAVEGVSVPLVEVVFAEERGGVERRLGMAEKRMRGILARYIVENDLCDIDQLRSFGESGDQHGYRFASASDDGSLLRFVKPSSPARNSAR